MKKLSFCLLAILTVLSAGVTLRAQELAAEKSRMESRLPKIDELKAKGAIGENNRGLLEVRGQDGEAAAVDSAENRDREAVYAGLAKKAGSTADQVGRARAKDIAGKSARGVWLQKDDGTWYKK